MKISTGIPSTPGDFPKLVCLIAFETSSIVGGRSRLVITGFCGIWSSTVGSTVEGLLSRVLKCSLHLALMLLFSLSRAEPSADRSGVVRGLVKNIFEFVLWQRRFRFSRPSSPTTRPAFCEVPPGSHSLGCRSQDPVVRRTVTTGCSGWSRRAVPFVLHATCCCRLHDGWN